MVDFSRVVSRLDELFSLVVRHAAPGSRLAMFSAYREAMADPMSSARVELEVRIAGRDWPLRLRASDMFTLAEVLHEGQYVLESELPEAPTIIDAGANVGISAVWLCAHHPGAVLHAFEPEAENFELLAANLSGLENSSAHRVAVGEREGSARLFVAEHGAMHSLADAAVGEETAEVRVIRLADYLSEAGIEHVDLLKLDVEGFEMEALRGLVERLPDVSVIAGEVHENVVEPDVFYRFMSEHGFQTVSRRPVTNPEEPVHMFEVARRN